MLSLSVDRWRERLCRLPLTLPGDGPRRTGGHHLCDCDLLRCRRPSGGPQLRPSFGVYLTVPAMIAATRHGESPGPARILAAATALWLPIEFDLLPALRLPPPNGFRATPLVGLTNGLFLFLVACPVAQDRLHVSAAPVRPAHRAAGRARVRRRRCADRTRHRVPRSGSRVRKWPRCVGAARDLPCDRGARGISLSRPHPERARAPDRPRRPAGCRDRFRVRASARIFAMSCWRRLPGSPTVGCMRGRERITASAVTHAFVNWIWLVLFRATSSTAGSGCTLDDCRRFEDLAVGLLLVRRSRARKRCVRKTLCGHESAASASAERGGVLLESHAVSAGGGAIRVSTPAIRGG